MQERRRTIRHDVALACSWQGERDTSDSRISDVSLGGCFIESATLPAIGEEVELTVVFDTPMSIIGRTVHTIQSFGFAIQFMHVDPVTLDRLGAWLHE